MRWLCFVQQYGEEVEIKGYEFGKLVSSMDRKVITREDTITEKYLELPHIQSAEPTPLCEVCFKPLPTHFCTKNICPECCESGKCPYKDICQYWQLREKVDRFLENDELREKFTDEVRKVIKQQIEKNYAKFAFGLGIGGLLSLAFGLAAMPKPSAPKIKELDKGGKETRGDDDG
jgi:hypothetical protein